MLWQQLRGGRLLGVKFKRQVPFAGYVADFSCAAARLIVEIDGPAHDDAAARRKDAARNAWFQNAEIDVLRFKDEEVLMGTDRVVKRIEAAVRTRRAPSPGMLRTPPSPCSGEGK
jgi:very-short-patch-repair endonuclease